MDHDAMTPLQRSLAALNSYLFGGRVLKDVLDEVSLRALDALPASFIAVIVSLEGRPNTAVFSDPLAKQLDDVQYAADRGPCLDSFRDGVVYITHDTRGERRWPEFCNAAADAGVLSTLSMPLCAADVHLGAMNCYSYEVDTFGDTEQEIGESFAGQASILLSNAQAYHNAQTMNENLTKAMESRAVIEQAKGILMSTMRCTPDEAFDVLTKQSQHENRKIREIAAELVSRTARR